MLLSCKRFNFRDQTMQLIGPSFIGHIFEHLSMHGLDPRKEGIMRFNLTIKESAFAWLCQVMGVHPSFIESLNYMVGQYAAFTHYSDDEQRPEVLRKLFLKTCDRRLTFLKISW
jgi:hypothetical protein